MKERLGRMLDMDTKWLWVSTFHSFCVRRLRDESDHIEPYKKNFNIIDDDDQAKIMRDIFLKRNELRRKSTALRTIKFDPRIKKEIANRETEVQNKIYKKFQFYNHFIKARQGVKHEKN